MVWNPFKPKPKPSPKPVPVVSGGTSPRATPYTGPDQSNVSLGKPVTSTPSGTPQQNINSGGGSRGGGSSSSSRNSNRDAINTVNSVNNQIEVANPMDKNVKVVTGGTSFMLKTNTMN